MKQSEVKKKNKRKKNYDRERLGIVNWLTTMAWILPQYGKKTEENHFVDLSSAR